MNRFRLMCSETDLIIGQISLSIRFAALFCEEEIINACTGEWQNTSTHAGPIRPVCPGLDISAKYFFAVSFDFSPPLSSLLVQKSECHGLKPVTNDAGFIVDTVRRENTIEKKLVLKCNLPTRQPSALCSPSYTQKHFACALVNVLSHILYTDLSL
jgi:hypothetical protein